jgi:protein-tyrosine-phosphatase
MHSVLLVCTANICRSPMAEALLRARLGEAAADWRIESAGTWALEGEGAAPRAIKVLKARGIDLSQHRSRVVDASLLNRARLVLVMEKGHKEALQVEFPRCAARVFLLSEMVGKDFEIADPMGRSTADFEKTAAELEDVLARGLGTIARLSEEYDA